MSSDIHAVLFDLDGTLLDTHQDLCNALNTVLHQHNQPTLPIATLRPFVSKGSMVMVCLAFKCIPGSAEAKKLWYEMLQVYEQRIAQKTTFFPGMEAVVDEIEKAGQPWGIVTNKPGYLTKQLLTHLGLSHRPASVINGDTLKVKKPRPEPLLLAANEMGVDPTTCLYIGDDERDILAGKAAKMKTLAAAYGYIVAEENPDKWGADGVINQPYEILDWLKSAK